MSKKNTLYVIGNGFDLYHNISSSYWQFQEYVKEQDKTLHNLVEDYLPIKENWSDFETALASLDVDYLEGNAGSCLVSYNAEDWSDSYHHDYQYEIEQVVEQLSGGLKAHFIDWLKQLKIPSRNEVSNSLISLNKNSLYLTFNYTSTLQDIYNIKTKKVVHIHGSLKKSENIVLGHAWKPENNQYIEEVYDPSEADTRVVEGNTILEGYFISTFKPTEEIIKKNKKFFKKLQKIHKVYILGHSLSDVDMEYFKNIVRNTDKKKTQWIVSYHGIQDKNNHRRQLNFLGIAKKNITFVKLKKLKS